MIARLSAPGHIAAIRFGLGPRPDQPPPAEPEAWLLAQLRSFPPAAGPDLAACAAVYYRPLDGNEEAQNALRVALLRQESLAWAERVLTTEAPFAERLVAFWANHFTVSRRRGGIAPFIGHYEREAIRPHILGRFEDLLLAAIRHPAMLLYLDNTNSVGPNSPAGRNRRRGLNENLARELLELHTLTPRAGYGEEDVRALAALLSGWSIGRGAAFQEPDGFFFRPGAHEPGRKILLGRSFPEGEEGGIEALRFLARHPATLGQLAFRLARHFAGDDPPPALIRRLEHSLLETQGDLGEAARLLITAPEAWQPPLSKFRSPLDYVIAVLRALGMGAEAAQPLLAGSFFLDQFLWNAPAPNGWPDTAAEWVAPEQLMRRIDWAHAWAGRAAAAGRVQAQALAELTLGPLLPAETATAIRRAGSQREALAILFGCPEFHRR
ncbi:MAG: DUF1800 domain-containing protein [Rhodovarius sp.]|nr:DUF1800 domain-containing protein [Rhodovarius sp.]MCX7932833.1 DUF1800 domain-containing protein [Rhodovarius sp.]MDW8313775.1 DUF1800 domain-containing protein [Rhodovarius sp.]